MKPNKTDTTISRIKYATCTWVNWENGAGCRCYLGKSGIPPISCHGCRYYEVNALDVGMRHEGAVKVLSSITGAVLGAWIFWAVFIPLIVQR